MNCPFCKGEKLIDLGRGSEITKHYIKTDTSGGGLFYSTKCEDWHEYYTTTKYLCVVCGLVHERMGKDSIDKLISNKPYEV